MTPNSTLVRAQECIRKMIPQTVVKTIPYPPDLDRPDSWRCWLCGIYTPIDVEHNEPSMANHSTFCPLREFTL